MPDAIVWISGASAGIGASLARTVPFADARVFDISRSGGAAGVEHLPADLADPSSWSAIEAHFLAQLGEFGGGTAVLIHSAGTLRPLGYAGEVDSAAYRAQVLLNAAAPQALGQGFLTAMRDADFAGQGHLVMLTSGAASSPYEGWSAYCAGKAAVNMWVRAVGAEQATRGGRCRVIAVGPGTVATAMQEQIREVSAHEFPRVEKFHRLYAEGELADPDEAARGIWALLDADLDNGAVTDLRSRS